MSQNPFHREFTRAPVDISGEITWDGGRRPFAKSRDLGLKGIYVLGTAGPPWRTPCRVLLTLGEGQETVRVEISGRVARADGAGLAVEFDEIPRESLPRLQALVLYHAKDPERVEREFQQHLGPRTK